MNRLLVLVEGQTEETFVNEILREHLVNAGYHSVEAKGIGLSRKRARKFGIKDWNSSLKEIERQLRGNTGCVITTMVDFYAMPAKWPGREEANGLPYPNNANRVIEQMLAAVCLKMGDDFNPGRFVPFVLMHEFEGLLFSDCEKFARGIGKDNLATELQSIRDGFGGPEQINDSVQTAPSKRILSLFEGYNKPLHGALAILEIGLSTIRQKCPLFNDWLGKLEEKAKASA